MSVLLCGRGQTVTLLSNPLLLQQWKPQRIAPLPVVGGSVVQWFILSSVALGQGPGVCFRARPSQTLQTLHTLQTEVSILHSDSTKIKHG